MQQTLASHKQVALSHMHAKLYRTHATVVNSFIVQTFFFIARATCALVHTENSLKFEYLHLIFKYHSSDNLKHITCDF